MVAADNDKIRVGGLFRRFWRFLWRPSTRFSLASLILGGFLVGVAFWASFETAIGYTNTLEFCRSCHEMEAFVYEDYAETTHYRNASGVRAVCADCHVPHATIPKLMTKMRATVNEVPRHLLGTINTEEKFEARREHMAERVWGRMEKDDSRACRNCHSREAMFLADQPLRAQREHETALETGETCIDCHKGIVHRLPASMLEDDEEDFDMGF